PRGQVRDRPGRARWRGGPPARRGRLARADREPVQARLRLRRAPPRHRRAARGPQAADRVVVRPVPEPQAHPRAGGGGPDPRGGPRGDQALRGAVRRLPAYRTLPARTPGGGGAAPGPRPRRASGRTDRRGSRDRQAAARPGQGGAQARCDSEWRELETLTERLGVRRRALEQFRSAYWQEFLNVVEVLEQFGAVRDRRLEPRGRLIAGLRHDNELLVAEGVFRGVF